jgi:hypothetical protein
MVGILTKQPFEMIDCSIDFAADVSSGTLTLDSCTAQNMATFADTTALVIATNPAPSVTGTVVSFRVQAGNGGENHKITVRVTQSNGDQFEADLQLSVTQQ